MMTPNRALWLSVVASLATMALKWVAWWVTGSVAFLSDALESLVNFAGASFALAMVWYARRPADRGHPYGHGKAEYFSAAFEGTLIVAAAAGIIIAAVERLQEPRPLQSLGLGTAFSAGASLINLVVAQVLLRVGRHHRSMATEADGQHLMTDVWTTAGVIVGVALADATGWYWLDPLLAIAVALNILREGWRLMWRSVMGLMDAALPEADIQAIESALQRLEARGGTFENLRTRVAGANRHGSVELRVPAHWSVARAHELAEAAERAAAEQGVTLVVRLVPASAERPVQARP